MSLQPTSVLFAAMDSSITVPGSLLILGTFIILIMQFHRDNYSNKLENLHTCETITVSGGFIIIVENMES